jgi:Holliday junction resolvase RusA-like endonuclease
MDNHNYFFVVSGEPFGKKRPRARVIAGHASIHNDPANENYELKVINAFRQAYPNLTNELGFGEDDYLQATITAYYSIPKSMSKKKRLLALDGTIRPTKKPDVDNIAKSILDALNSVLYKDDSQVVRLVVGKHYADVPRVEVSITKI